MNSALLFCIVVLSSVNFNTVFSRKNGFPCSVQTSMAPNFDDPPQFVEKNPPPYNFYILRENGDPVKYYDQEAYTIKINGSNYFRKFIIQARPSTKNGTLITNVRAGEFVYDPVEWNKQGVQVLQCPSVLNDTITHVNGQKKSMIEVKWISRRNEGPIQFLITIALETSMYWVQWSPKSGLIIPSNHAKFSGFIVPPKKKPQDIFKNEVRFLSAAHVSQIENNKNNGLDDLTADEKEALFQINQHRQTVPVTTNIPVTLHPDLVVAPVVININPQKKATEPKTDAPLSTAILEKTSSSSVSDHVVTHTISTTTKDKEKTTKKVVSKDFSTRSTRVILTSTTSKVPVTHATSIRTTTTPTPTPIQNETKISTKTESIETTVDLETTEDVSGSEEETSGDENNSTSSGDFSNETTEHITLGFSSQLNLTHGSKMVSNETKMNTNESFEFHNSSMNRNESFDLHNSSMSMKNKNGSVEKQKEIKNVSHWDNFENHTKVNVSMDFHHENATRESPCFNITCLNNGSCHDLSDTNYTCMCTKGWIGSHCQKRNYCSVNECKNGGVCKNGNDSFTCLCSHDFLGDLCEYPCPFDKCKNGGVCVLDSFNKSSCTCKPGFNGTDCQSKLDECDSNPCMNNATCIVSKPGTFKCLCPDGYMGTKCQRPCQDNYLSCVSWQEEDKCTQMRSATKFYDINCAATCGQCVFVNSTIRTTNPLPPVLEPFHNLLGTWFVNYSSPKRYPLDFPDAPKGYYEELSFFITTLPVFGTPSINYTAIAVNNADPTDAQTNVGFMTLKPFTEPTNVSIISTGNDGITIIEEGLLYNGSEMNLLADLFYINPNFQSKSLSTLQRSFKFDGNFLEESVERMGSNGESDSFRKSYKKLNQYILY